MASQFTHIVNSDFMAFFAEIEKEKNKKLEISVREMHGFELVYELKTKYEHFSYLIYTSIPKHHRIAVSREKGVDAIRLVPYDPILNRPINVTEKIPHIKRIVGWKKNLKERMKTVFLLVKELKTCPKCGSYMTDFGPFYGCQSYKKDSATNCPTIKKTF